MGPEDEDIKMPPARTEDCTPKEVPLVEEDKDGNYKEIHGMVDVGAKIVYMTERVSLTEDPVVVGGKISEVEANRTTTYFLFVPQGELESIVCKYSDYVSLKPGKRLTLGVRAEEYDRFKREMGKENNILRVSIIIERGRRSVDGVKIYTTEELPEEQIYAIVKNGIFY